ncbi:MAG: response regulator transcription factor, partial [Desulfobacterales bacterium]|nr:response regulator transcription factor [Desulfobacterales bacterium]
MKPIRVLIVDDHQIVRDNLGHHLEGSKKYEVIARARNGRKAIELAETLMPELTLMDVSMPDMNGIEATRQIVANNPSAKVVALTMHTAKPYVLGMLNAGASGYLLKTSSFEEFCHGLDIIMGGTIFLSPEVTHMVVEFAKNREWEETDSLSLLSVREREVLQLISEGHTSKAISGMMNISAKTVDVHRNNIKKKLDI